MKTGESKMVIKSPSIGRVWSGSSMGASEIVLTASRKKRFSSFKDTVRVMKAGYLNSRISVTNPDTSDIAIKMIKQDAGTVTDIDGNVYTAIRIGNQIWTVENLRVTKFKLQINSYIRYLGTETINQLISPIPRSFITFSPDDSKVLSGFGEGTALLWDVSDITSLIQCNSVKMGGFSQAPA
jgi:hypothetical protein